MKIWRTTFICLMFAWLLAGLISGQRIFEHTLALPERLRILKGWSHLDTITGRYCLESGRSELFPRVVEDLLSVMPPPED